MDDLVVAGTIDRKVAVGAADGDVAVQRHHHHM